MSASIDHPVPQLLVTERSLVLPAFGHATAYSLGNLIRQIAVTQHPTSTIFISVTSTTSATAANSPSPPLILYQTCTGPDYLPDHMHWLERKRNTVLRFGCSSLIMREKMRRVTAAGLISDDDAQEKFVQKFGLDGTKFVANGGGVPIRVRGVDGIVGVVCVSGVKQEEDHGLAIQGLKLLKEQLESAAVGV